MSAFGRLVSGIMPATEITSPSRPGMMPDHAGDPAPCARSWRFTITCILATTYCNEQSVICHLQSAHIAD